MKETFVIKIWKDSEWWLAEIKLGELNWITQGRTEEELWDMVADSILCAKNIPTSWWNSLLKKLLVY